MLRTLPILLLALLAGAELDPVDAQRRGRGGGGGPAGQRGGGGQPPAPKPPRPSQPSRPPASTAPRQVPEEPFTGFLLPEPSTPAPPAVDLALPADQARPPAGERVQPVPLDELPELADLQQQYFLVADYDADGWVSFREAEESMELDRSEFRGFDADRDGRIRPDEFAERVEQTVSLVGSFPPPRPRKETSPAATEASQTQALVASADRDRDGHLDEFELQELFDAFGVRDVETELVMNSYDRDLSGALDASELSDIASALRDGSLAIAPAPTEPPESIDELFGVPVPRAALPGGGAPTLPSRLIGPVTHFHRLDANRDGAVTPDDLLALQSPLNVDVRARAIVAFLDADGDGSLTREELRSAFE